MHRGLPALRGAKLRCLGRYASNFVSKAQAVLWRNTWALCSSLRNSGRQEPQLLPQRSVCFSKGISAPRLIACWMASSRTPKQLHTTRDGVPVPEWLALLSAARRLLREGRVAADVDAALRQVLISEAAMDDSAARQWLLALARQGRYCRDVY